MYELIASREPPSITIGAARRVRAQTLRQWIAEHVEGATREDRCKPLLWRAFGDRSTSTPLPPVCWPGQGRRRVTSTSRTRYPHARARLVGEDGNAFAILGWTKRALQRAGAGDDEAAAFFREATAGDYDRLLATVLRWVEAE